MNEERKFLHDIASPLTVLRMSVENVQEILLEWRSAEADECKRLLESILANSSRMANMIRDRRELLAKEEE